MLDRALLLDNECAQKPPDFVPSLLDVCRRWGASEPNYSALLFLPLTCTFYYEVQDGIDGCIRNVLKSAVPQSLLFMLWRSVLLVIVTCHTVGWVIAVKRILMLDVQAFHSRLLTGRFWVYGLTNHGKLFHCSMQHLRSDRYLWHTDGLGENTAIYRLTGLP